MRGLIVGLRDETFDSRAAARWCQQDQALIRADLRALSQPRALSEPQQLGSLFA